MGRVLSVVIPAFNEVEHIVDVVSEVLEARPRILAETALDDVEVLVVNDGSTDGTGDVLTQAGLSPVRIETHPVNMGYGAALKTGFRHAKGDYLAFMDGDGTIDPLSLIGMFRALDDGNVDMVVGKRLGTGASQMPLTRQIGNIFFAHLLSWLSGTRVTDTASGIRIFKREILPRLLPLPDGLHFTPAMSSRAVHERLRLREIPVPYANRQGQSKLHVIKDGLRFLRIILGTVLMYNPFKVFSVVGFVGIVAALFLVWKPIVFWINQTPFLFTDFIYRAIAALLMAVCGIQVILFGILARFIVSTFFRRHESGSLIHRVNDYLRVYDRMGLYGLFVSLLGGMVTLLYYSTYISFGNLDLHWAWLMVAAALVITGVQMMITRLVMAILSQIKAALVASGTLGSLDSV